jgi:hypothetical protein
MHSGLAGHTNCCGRQNFFAINTAFGPKWPATAKPGKRNTLRRCPAVIPTRPSHLQLPTLNH